jgi:hypothetical protein
MVIHLWQKQRRLKSVKIVAEKYPPARQRNGVIVLKGDLSIEMIIHVQKML